jgi:hypothetical protein
VERSDAEVGEALDHLAICRLQARYGDVVTRRAWQELDPLFAPGCPVTLDLREGRVVELAGATAVGRFIEGAIERFEFFEFALLNSVVDLDGDRAHGRLYMWELREGTEPAGWSNAFGVYHDDYARLDGRWVFARRRYSSLARTGDGPSQVFTIPPARTWPAGPA